MRLITLTMKTSLEIPLFQLSQTKDHLEWRHMVNAW
jgi:hypothetical protein